jgi:hypothetical protein
MVVAISCLLWPRLVLLALLLDGLIVAVIPHVGCSSISSVFRFILQTCLAVLNES